MEKRWTCFFYFKLQFVGIKFKVIFNSELVYIKNNILKNNHYNNINIILLKKHGKSYLKFFFFKIIYEQKEFLCESGDAKSNGYIIGIQVRAYYSSKFLSFLIVW
jgi:hypothetical protein